jgi:hypothetical protein
VNFNETPDTMRFSFTHLASWISTLVIYKVQYFYKIEEASLPLHSPTQVSSTWAFEGEKGFFLTFYSLCRRPGKGCPVSFHFPPVTNRIISPPPKGACTAHFIPLARIALLSLLLHFGYYQSLPEIRHFNPGNGGSGFIRTLISAHKTTWCQNSEGHNLETKNNHSSELIVNSHTPIIIYIYIYIIHWIFKK